MAYISKDEQWKIAKKVNKGITGKKIFFLITLIYSLAVLAFFILGLILYNSDANTFWYFSFRIEEGHWTPGDWWPNNFGLFPLITVILAGIAIICWTIFTILFMRIISPKEAARETDRLIKGSKQGRHKK